MLAGAKVFSCAAPKRNYSSSKSLRVSKRNCDLKKNQTANFVANNILQKNFYQYYSTKQAVPHNAPVHVVSTSVRPTIKIVPTKDNEKFIVPFLRSHKFDKALENYKKDSKHIGIGEYIYLIEFAFSDPKYHQHLEKFYRDLGKKLIAGINLYLSKTIHHNLIHNPIVPFEEIWEDIKELSKYKDIPAITFGYFFDIYSKLGEFEKFNELYTFASSYTVNVPYKSDGIEVLFNEYRNTPDYKSYQESFPSFNSKAQEPENQPEFDLEEVRVRDKFQEFYDEMKTHYDKSLDMEALVSELEQVLDEKLTSLEDNVIEETITDNNNNNEAVTEAVTEANPSENVIEEDEVAENAIDEEIDEALDEEIDEATDEDAVEYQSQDGVSETEVKLLFENAPKLYTFILARCNFADIDGYYQKYIESAVGPYIEVYSAIFDRINEQIEKNIAEQVKHTPTDQKPTYTISAALGKQFHKYYIDFKQNFPLQPPHLEILLNKCTSSIVADKYATLFLAQGVKMTEECYSALFNVYQREFNSTQKVDNLYSHMIASLPNPKYDRYLYSEEHVKKLQEHDNKMKQQKIEDPIERLLAAAEDTEKEQKRDWMNFIDACKAKLKSEIKIRQLKKLAKDPRWPAYIEDYINPKSVNRPLAQSWEKGKNALNTYLEFFNSLITAAPPSLQEKAQKRNFQQQVIGQDDAHAIAKIWLDANPFSLQLLITDLASFPLLKRYQIAEEVFKLAYEKNQAAQKSLQQVEDKLYIQSEQLSYSLPTSTDSTPNVAELNEAIDVVIAKELQLAIEALKDVKEAEELANTPTLEYIATLPHEILESNGIKIHQFQKSSENPKDDFLRLRDYITKSVELWDQFAIKSNIGVNRAEYLNNLISVSNGRLGENDVNKVVELYTEESSPNSTPVVVSKDENWDPSASEFHKQIDVFDFDIKVNNAVVESETAVKSEPNESFTDLTNSLHTLGDSIPQSTTEEDAKSNSANDLKKTTEILAGFHFFGEETLSFLEQNPSSFSYVAPKLEDNTLSMKELKKLLKEVRQKQEEEDDAEIQTDEASDGVKEETVNEDQNELANQNELFELEDIDGDDWDIHDFKSNTLNSDQVKELVAKAGGKLDKKTLRELLYAEHVEQMEKDPVLKKMLDFDPKPAYGEYYETEKDFEQFSFGELHKLAESLKNSTELNPYQKTVLQSFTYKDIVEDKRLIRPDTELFPSTIKLNPSENTDGFKEYFQMAYYETLIGEIEEQERALNPKFPLILSHNIFRQLIKYEAEVGKDLRKAINYYLDLVHYQIVPSEGVYYWLLKLTKEVVEAKDYLKYTQIIDHLYHDWKAFLPTQIPSKRVDKFFSVLPSRKKDIIHLGRLQNDPAYRAKNLLRDEYLHNPKRFDRMVNGQYANQLEIKGYFHESISNHGLDSLLKEKTLKDLTPILSDTKNQHLYVDSANIRIYLDQDHQTVKTVFEDIEKRRNALQSYIATTSRILDQDERLKFGIPVENTLTDSIPAKTPEEVRN